MSTIQDVAKLAGVSAGSVSHYINGKQLRPLTASKIQQAIEELGYNANIFGKALRHQRSYSVGVLVNDTNNVFSNAIYTNIETHFQKEDYTTLMMDYRGDMKEIKSKLKFLLSRQVDAIVIIMSEQKLIDYSWLKDVHVPVVIFDNPILDDYFPCIVVDNVQSVTNVISNMINSGHERVGMITPPDDTFVGQQRRIGWYNAYSNNQKAPNQNDLMICPYNIESGYQAMMNLLDKKQVTAVFAANYYLAVGALRAVIERNLTIGRDIEFASFDDLGIVGSIIGVPVTVVEQPIEHMAEYAVTTILAMLDSQREDWPKGIKVFNSFIKSSIQ